MRYLVLSLVGILVFVLVPGLVGAQGFPSPVGMGLPSLGQLWAASGRSSVSDPQSNVGLAFNIGYLTTERKVGFDLSAQPLVGPVVSREHEYTVKGLWLAVSADVPVRNGFGIWARGSWLFPSAGQAYKTLQMAGGTLEPIIWQTDIQWYNVDLAGTYSPYGALTVIGGFRFDSFATNFHSREFVEPEDLSTDEADMTVSSYIPYVGIMLNQGGGLKLGLVGFPYVPGDVEYSRVYGRLVMRQDAKGSLRSSYFVEAFGEYGRQLMGGYVGVFGIFSYLHANSVLDVTRRLAGVETTSGEYHFSLDRANWIVGGTLGIDFTSPI
ncbi:MAG: hypothetical protein AB1664_16305 [Thermodesulfobacteriota bacterium]